MHILLQLKHDRRNEKFFFRWFVVVSVSFEYTTYGAMPCTLYKDCFVLLHCVPFEMEILLIWDMKIRYFFRFILIVFFSVSFDLFSAVFSNGANQVRIRLTEESFV